MHDEAVHAFYPYFLGTNQIANLKIAVLNGGLFIHSPIHDLCSHRGGKGRAAIHWAVGDPETLELVMKHGGDVNMIDGNGASPLLLAIAHSRPASARLLIEAGTY